MSMYIYGYIISWCINFIFLTQAIYGNIVVRNNYEEVTEFYTTSYLSIYQQSSDVRYVRIIILYVYVWVIRTITTYNHTYRSNIGIRISNAAATIVNNNIYSYVRTYVYILCECVFLKRPVQMVIVISTVFSK